MRSSSVTNKKKSVIFQNAGNESATDHQKEGGTGKKLSKGQSEESKSGPSGQLADLGITYEAKDAADKLLENEHERKINSLKTVKDAIFFFGPTTKIFKFAIKTRSWHLIKIEKKCMFKGGIKH